MKDKKMNETYCNIISKFEIKNQIIVAVEELSELQKELLKDLRFFEEKKLSSIDNITEEMADVEIMLDQLKIIYNNKEDIEKVKKIKIHRTVERYLK